MADKASFSADEWSRIVGSPAIVTELETSEGRTMARDAFKSQLTTKTPAELKAQAIEALTSLGQIVDAKAS